ncbi:MAG: DUF362 domain-containing protein [Patescibacteria group bacterium]|jgi:uncharacterized protein (DUF362 family)
MAKVAFIKSNDRRYNISRSLSLIKSEIISGLKNAKKVVVKPNCIVDDFQLAATHVDALDALLDFIAPYCKNQITVAEGTGIGDTMNAFRNYEYFSVQEKYGFAAIDLNIDETEEVEVFDRNGRKFQVLMSKTILDSDYLISLCVPKTHDSVVYTGAIKNVAVGSLHRPVDTFSGGIVSMFRTKRNNKASIHQGYKYMNENLKILALKKVPNLAVIDGFAAMQGDGPAHGGEMVPSHWAIASSDVLSADILSITMMGIDLKDVGYLSLLNEENRPSEPFVIGDDWRSNILKFKLHSKFNEMKKWQ